MPDYKMMYNTLFRVTEQAINLLIAAQRTCEEYYMEQSEQEPKIRIIRSLPKTENSVEEG